MFKKIYFFLLLFFCFSVQLHANALPAKKDSLINILHLTDTNLRERKLIRYIRTFFEENPVNGLNTAKNRINQLILTYNIENKAAYDFFIEGMYQTRMQHMIEAENLIVKAIDQANKSSDHFLLYTFFSQLAFLQTYVGNTIEAISSFRMAKKEATILNDAYLQVVIDINISDIYYRNNFYSQSLFYLNQAQNIFTLYHVNEPRLKNSIYNNKAENYFRINNADSLKKYNELLNNIKSGTYKLYIYKKRTDYYLDLLHHDYKNAIKHIVALKSDTLYRFDNADDQNLADAYHYAGKPDSAKYIINRLLADKAQNNHPEIKFHLYKVLGEIAEKENDYKQSAYNFKLALLQSEDHINRLTQVGNISSQIKIDEMQGFYIKKEADYKKERIWLIFMVIVTLLSIVIVAMFYRNTKQKQYYEKLLFTSKKEELAHINSHEVRKHLSNILGIIELIKHGKDRHAEYIEVEEYLLSETEKLDIAIKNISNKLE